MARTLVAVAGSIVMMPTLALAQPQSIQPPPPRPAQAAPSDGESDRALRQGPPPVSFELGIDGVLGFNSDLDDGGDVTISRISPSLGVAFVIDQRSRLTLSAELEYSNYDFSGNTGLGPRPNNPWQDIFRETLGVNYFRTIDDQWSILLGVSAGFAHEDGAKLSESFEAGLIAAATYAISPSLRVGLGVGVFTQIEDNPLIIPVPAVDWRINEHLRLTNNNRPGLFLAYTPTEQWTLTLGAAYESRDYRLDRNGPVPSGVGRDRRFPVLLEAAYTPSRMLKVSARAGVDLGVRYELSDSEGNEIAERDGDPAPFIGLNATLRF